MQVRLAIIGGESRIIKGLTSTAVTSRVDVWIETTTLRSIRLVLGHISRGCVD